MSCLLFSCGQKEETENEIKGVWISYIELSQWLNNADEETFRERVQVAYQNIKELGLNTVYVHASAFTDAFYDSDIYPSSHLIDGELGNSLEYDPYQILVEEAKKTNLRFEAWINPLRSHSEKLSESLPSSFIIKQWILSEEKNGDWIVLYKGRYYLNPAQEEVIDLVCAVIIEIIGKYDVDGIHMDDYFYPEGIDASFDARTFQESGEETLAAYRIESTNNLVKTIYSAIKVANNNTTLSISPSGNITNNIELVYADVEEWVTHDGYLDYIIPQVYWGFEHSRVPYETVIKDWQNMITNENVKLVIGLGAYRHHEEVVSDEWKQADLLARQIESARKLEGYEGIVLYSYQSLFPKEDSSFLIEIRKLIKEVIEQ